MSNSKTIYLLCTDVSEEIKILYASVDINKLQNEIIRRDKKYQIKEPLHRQKYGEMHREAMLHNKGVGVWDKPEHGDIWRDFVLKHSRYHTVLETYSKNRLFIQKVKML